MHALSGLPLAAARRAVGKLLKDAGVESTDLDARLLIGEVTGLDLTGLVSQAGRPLTAEEAERLAGFTVRRLAGEPVARIFGQREFWGLPLRLSADTLVPRPDTETVVEVALELLRAEARPQPRILDIGTGSGAILLALLSECRDATGVATDISLETLRIARANAAALGLADRAGFVAGDYAAALSGPFDLIVSNPPYIPAGDIAALDIEVRDHDPRLALDGGADGLDAYRRIAPESMRLLRPGGALVVEFGQGQSGAVVALMRTAGLTVSSPPRADLGGILRVAVGCHLAP
ncbi:peptide chain release factor N(5)-glutamine methyltransferase [Rhodopseudomonas sp. HC1]|uniref:peptide chain release factor N(5)-glutamine methyltransferase n=1 Tax=Rhodopseudomonas infernalis TaxID=2897386 RepID=UPI001EE95ABF|nr:peptide chain release factor N(5)-glutamine methyltransferase [Rhodopseudomonas infernalis]MCG6203917.1 peptide chain release factor N(5)-glutamine methyltransferase [Rhodopseudomonas infernalis]